MIALKWVVYVCIYIYYYIYLWKTIRTKLSPVGHVRLQYLFSRYFGTLGVKPLAADSDWSCLFQNEHRFAAFGFNFGAWQHNYIYIIGMINRY